MIESTPKIGVVIIGINVEKFLGKCIESILNSDYPRESLQIIYVDGGSQDDSVKIARSFSGIEIAELDHPFPTPGRGRNAGWAWLDTPLVQFLDADTVLDPQWFKRAIPCLKNQVAAVCGHRRELQPDKNWFHFIGNKEWNYETGPCRYFGGDVLIKREVLEQTGGFDEDLVAGEDPELSYRIRQRGHVLLRVDAPMTKHDLNMTTVSQYMRRAFRSGHAYAEVCARFWDRKEKLWLREFLRVQVKAWGLFGILVTGFVLDRPIAGFLLGMTFVLLAVIRQVHFRTDSDDSLVKRITYATHSVFVVLPQFLGTLRYFGGILTSNPLKNKGKLYTGERLL